MPERDASLDGDLRDPLEQRPQRLAIDELAELDERLGVGSAVGIDAAEAPTGDVAADFPLEPIVAPAAKVPKHEHPQHDLGRSSVTALRAALWIAAAQRAEHGLEQGLVIEDFVDATQGGVHQLLESREHSEQDEL